MINGTEVRKQLRDWILEHAKDKPEELDYDTPVLELGILSSLDVVELILFVESMKGEEIDIDAIEPSSLENINSMVQGFFGG